MSRDRIIGFIVVVSVLILISLSVALSITGESGVYGEVFCFNNDDVVYRGRVRGRGDVYRVYSEEYGTVYLPIDRCVFRVLDN